MRTSESIKALAPALTLALGKLEGAAKTAKNPHFKNTYADLASVVDASRSILAESDLAVMQSPGLIIEGRLQLFTRIIHKSGEWIEGEFHMPLAKSDPQATLATLTYARRGALMAILGIPAVDDDGETAVGRGTDTAASKPRQQTAPQEAPKPPTLSERADRFVTTLRGLPTPAERERAYKLASKLLADLDASDPERLVEINRLYDELRAEQVAA
jgi:ERF superfamily